MAPKKKVEEAPPEPVDLDLAPEEDEEGPGKVAISVDVLSAQDLPCELETTVSYAGFCQERRSTPAAQSAAPSGWTFPKSRVIRTINQSLFDDLVHRPLVITLRNPGDSSVIGQASVSLLPLLHDQLEVGGDLEVKLTEPYHAKWFPQAEPEAAVPGGKDDPKAKNRGRGAAAPAAPEPAIAVRPPGWTPPPTRLTVRVSVPDQVGPGADRHSWTTLTLRVAGVFSLPVSLTSLGEAAVHPVKYRARFFGEDMGVGALAKPVEVEEEGADGSEHEAELPEAEWRERRQRLGYSVRFKDGAGLVRYRGAAFLAELRHQLNRVGGVWFFFALEEKPSTDPKKPNPPEVAAMTKLHAGKAWLDLRPLIRPGVRAVEACCALTETSSAPPPEGEPTLASSRTFVRLSVELRSDVAGMLPKEERASARQLLPPPQRINRFPPSSEASDMFVEAVEQGVEVICRDCRLPSGAGPAGVAEAVHLLKKAGSYEQLKGRIRGAVVGVFRERLRKDTRTVPGKPPDDALRDDIVSGTYAHLKTTVAEVLQELRRSHPMPAIPAGEVEDRGSRSPSRSPSSQTEVPPPPNPVAVALAESAAVRKAREALGAAADAGERCARLAFEAELVGNFARAATMAQNRLVLETLAREPREWIAYAKLCMRARGRQAAAEEALTQAVALLASGGVPHSEATAAEVDLMLASLLLDRGRHEEAIKVFRVWHEQDLAEPLYSLLLGLGLFLSGEEEAWKPMLEAAGKPREWFQGLPDDTAVESKLRALRATSGPPDAKRYSACLERLLDFGLSSLVFTFLDQCKAMPPEALDQEPLIVMDAKASALDRDFAAAAARLEPVLVEGKASLQAWLLAGECYFQMQEWEKALHAFQQALALEPHLEDAAVYIRLGSLLLVKKRWRQARDTLLRSVQCRPTAEAWSGIAHAEFRSEELQTSYEALCEASLLDSDRADVWAQLTLVHLRLENWESADVCLRECMARKPDCHELLVEVASEYSRRERAPLPELLVEVAAEYVRRERPQAYLLGI